MQNNEEIKIKIEAMKKYLEEEAHRIVKEAMNSPVTPEEKPFSDYYSKVSKNCTYPPNLPKVDPETVFTEDQREIFNHLLNCIDYCLRDNAIKSQRVYVLENNVEEMYERVAVLSYHVEVLSDQLNKLASILNNMFKPS